MTEHPFDLLILDCDGVLVDSEVISARMLTAALADHGVALTLPFFTRHFLGRSYPTVLAEVRRHWGVDLPEGFEAAYRARLLAAFDDALAPMPGVAAMLQGLALPFCLATSSSPERTAHALRLTGLDGAFAGRIFTASEVARGKPAPDLFLHAAARMGADPARTLVIEDSETGIRAGLAAGMTVWRFTGGSHLRGLDIAPPPDAVPHAVLADFAAMRVLCPSLFHGPT
jgi:HAD superfamily hydrolase (TIGR01509 family)